MANDALQVNYDQTPIAITRNGSNWLWAAFAVMVSSKKEKAHPPARRTVWKRTITDKTSCSPTS